MNERTTEDLLILTKTYPNPSAKHRETTCVAALNRSGEMRRLFPIPYRFLDGEARFSKWEWVRAIVMKATGDNRPESRRIDVDTIVRSGIKVGTEQGWAERRKWVEPHLLPNFVALETRRQVTGETLGFLRPHRLIGLEIIPVKEVDWTEQEKAKLFQEGLFDTQEARHRPPLRKIPFDFHYHYECQAVDGTEILRHKLTDWEVGALYWNCYHRHGSLWEKPFRQRLEIEFAEKDLLFLMGTMHRFPDKWLIVGLVYPPKLQRTEAEQLSLGLAL